MSLCDRCGDCLELVPNCTCDRDHLDWSAFGPREAAKPVPYTRMSITERPDGSAQVAA